MNIYDVTVIEKEIDIIARDNDGEIPEELLKDLVEKQTQSVAQINGLCQFIRHLEMGIDSCKDEEKRIADMRKRAENRIESIKKYLTPFVVEKKKFTAGTFTLSVRKSESVDLEENFYHSVFSIKSEVIKSDKSIIKKALKNGVEIPGAKLIEKQNLQIK